MAKIPLNRLRSFKKVCPFCNDKKEPNYKNVEELRRFTTERGKILSREKTGICAKHQRRVTVAIKRARYLALLPFIKNR